LKNGILWRREGGRKGEGGRGECEGEAGPEGERGLSFTPRVLKEHPG